MKQSYKRGFTLIELLVVIAIIGILAAIILASLSTARSKGNDAKVESQLQSMQQAAEIFYSSNANSYGTSTLAGGTATGSGVCNPGTSDTSGLATLELASSWPTTASQPTCSSTATSYIVYAQLVSNTADYWCVDSTGVSKTETATPGSATACP